MINLFLTNSESYAKQYIEKNDNTVHISIPEIREAYNNPSDEKIWEVFIQSFRLCRFDSNDIIFSFLENETLHDVDIVEMIEPMYTFRNVNIIDRRLNVNINE
jgi:hypothetical protein